MVAEITPITRLAPEQPVQALPSADELWVAVRTAQRAAAHAALLPPALIAERVRFWSEETCRRAATAAEYAASARADADKGWGAEGAARWACDFARASRASARTTAEWARMYARARAAQERATTITSTERSSEP